MHQPRQWLKDASMSEVDLVRQPFEKERAEGPPNNSAWKFPIIRRLDFFE